MSQLDLGKVSIEALQELGFSCQEEPVNEVSEYGSRTGFKRACSFPADGAEGKLVYSALERTEYHNLTREAPQDQVEYDYGNTTGFSLSNGVRDYVSQTLLWTGRVEIGGTLWWVRVEDKGANGWIDSVKIIKPAEREIDGFEGAQYYVSYPDREMKCETEVREARSGWAGNEWRTKLVEVYGVCEPVQKVYDEALSRLKLANPNRKKR